MKTKFVLVTCIFELDKYVKRNNSTYLSLFRWIYNLNIPTIVYISKSLRNKIKKHKLMHIIEVDINTFPNIKLINIIDSNKIKTPSNISKHTSYYFGIVTSKAYLLNKAKIYIEENISELKNKHIIWIDSGIAHVGTMNRNKFINNLNYIISDKINLTMMCATSEIELSNIGKFISNNKGKIAGGLIIVPWKYTQWLSDKITYWFSECIINYNSYTLEEQLLPIIANNNKDKFKYTYSDYWVLYNLSRITVRIDCVIKNLSYCRNNSIWDIGIEVLYVLLKSINKGKIFINKYQLCRILLDGVIISHYKDKILCKNMCRLINYLYNHNEDCKIILNNDTHIKNNIVFANINLDEDLGTDILNEDLSQYIWIIL